MHGILTGLSRKRWLLVAAVALVLAPFMTATSYAHDVPINISYTGTLVPIPVNLSGGPTPSAIVDAQSHGSFGASMSHIVTEWVADPGASCGDDLADYDYYYLLHAAVVVTFSNDDQLFGTGASWLGQLSGWMCLNPDNGHFVGVAEGGFSGGTGRFEGATGTFTSPFSGYNLTAFDFGYGSGPIHGTIEGTVSLQ